MLCNLRILFEMNKNVETLGASLTLKTGVPTYQVEDGLPRRRSASTGPAA